MRFGLSHHMGVTNRPNGWGFRSVQRDNSQSYYEGSLHGLGLTLCRVVLQDDFEFPSDSLLGADVFAQESLIGILEAVRALALRTMKYRAVLPYLHGLVTTRLNT